MRTQSRISRATARAPWLVVALVTMHCGPGRRPLGGDAMIEDLDAAQSVLDLGVTRDDGLVQLADGAVIEASPAEGDGALEGSTHDGPSRDALDEAFVPPDVVLPPEDAGCVPAHATPPPEGLGAAPTMPERVYVSPSFVLGSDPMAWRFIGLDRDELCGAEAPAAMPTAMTRACARRTAGAPEIVDGLGGRDNAFAALVAPALRRVTRWSEADVEDAILAGTGSVAVRVVGASAGRSSRVTLEWHRVQLAPANRPAGFSSSEAWQRLSGPNGQPAAEAYLNGEQLVARFDTPLDLFVPGTQAPLRIRLRNARLTAQLVVNPEGGPGALSLTRTVLSGLWSLDDVAGDLGTMGLCPASTGYDDVQSAVQSAADLLLSEGHEPATPCEAISVGLAFDMTPARLGATATAPEPRSCP